MGKGVGKLGNHTYHLVDPWNSSLRKDHMVVALAQNFASQMGWWTRYQTNKHSPTRHPCGTLSVRHSPMQVPKKDACIVIMVYVCSFYSVYSWQIHSSSSENKPSSFLPLTDGRDNRKPSSEWVIFSLNRDETIKLKPSHSTLSICFL